MMRKNSLGENSRSAKLQNNFHQRNWNVILDITSSNWLYLQYLFQCEPGMTKTKSWRTRTRTRVYPATSDVKYVKRKHSMRTCSTVFSVKTIYCAPCWKLSLPHRKKGVYEHVPIDPHIVRRLELILNRSSSISNFEKLLEKDEPTAWFGEYCRRSSVQHR